MNELNKLLVRLFPEYIHEADQLLKQMEILEAIKEYQSCESAVQKFEQTTEEGLIYRELMIELKREIQSLISRHLGVYNPN